MDLSTRTLFVAALSVAFMTSLKASPAWAGDDEPELAPPHGACQSKIVFSATPRDIEEHEFIRTKVELAGLLSSAAAAAPFVSAFDGNPVKFSYNLANADWDAWSEAILGLDDGLRGLLRKHANDIAVVYAMRNDSKRLRYWRCVAASF